MEFRTLEGEYQKFRIAEVGEGPPIVLLHGFPDTPQSWAATADVLAEAGYRVLIPYLRGYHPDTVVKGRSYGRDEIGGDVINLLDDFQLESAILVGHDWGASCVWSAATLAPERVRGLVAIAVPHPATIKPSLGLLWKGRHFINLKLPGGARRMKRGRLRYVKRLYKRWAPAWTGAERDDAVARAKKAFSNSVVRDHSVRWYKDLKPSAAEHPDPIGVPGLLVTGEHDFGGDLAPYERSLKVLDESSELLVVDDAGHWPHREGQSEFHSALLGFLDGL